MTTSTLENNETIQEAIRDLEEQWKKENEERMNDYKEKLNVIEGYLNEQYSINKEIKSLGESITQKMVSNNKINLKVVSHTENQYMETQKFLTYLRGTDKKTSSTVREMFGVVTKTITDSMKVEPEEHERCVQINDSTEDLTTWKKHYNEIKDKIDNLIDGDNYLGMLANKLPIHSMNRDFLFQILVVLEDITILDNEMESIVKKYTKIGNKVKLDQMKIGKRMINLGFCDIYDELTEGNQSSGKPVVVYR